MTIKIKRVYEAIDESDGMRILVDRMWPRGLSKDKAKLNLWLKDIAPGNELREWFAHDRGKWHEFKRRYFEELTNNRYLVDSLIEKAQGNVITLLYGAKDHEFNNAVALKEFIVNSPMSPGYRGIKN